MIFILNLLNVEIVMAYEFGKFLKKVMDYTANSFLGQSFQNLSIVKQILEYKAVLLNKGREINFNIDNIMFESTWDLSDYSGTYNSFGLLDNCGAILCAAAHGFVQDNVDLTSEELLKNYLDLEIKQTMFEIMHFMRYANLVLNMKVISFGNALVCFYTFDVKPKSECAEKLSVLDSKPIEIR